MLLILLDIVHNSAGDLHSGQQIEIPEDKKDLAILVEMLDHVVLEHEEVVLFLVFGLGLVAARVHNLVLAVVVSVPEREHVVPQLDDCHWEVHFGQFEV